MKKRIIANKKGSMMLEYMLLMVVGLIVMAAFNAFLSAGKDVMDNSVKNIKGMEKSSDSNDVLGTFKKID